MQPFNIRTDTFKIDVTTTSSTSKAIKSGRTIRIVNYGYSTAFVSIGNNGTQTATIPATNAVSTCTPILAGQDTTFSLDGVLDGSHGLEIAAISDGSTTLYVSVGDGI